MNSPEDLMAASEEDLITYWFRCMQAAKEGVPPLVPCELTEDELQRLEGKADELLESKGEPC